MTSYLLPPCHLGLDSKPLAYQVTLRAGPPREPLFSLHWHRGPACSETRGQPQAPPRWCSAHTSPHALYMVLPAGRCDPPGPCVPCMPAGPTVAWLMRHVAAWQHGTMAASTVVAAFSSRPSSRLYHTHPAFSWSQVVGWMPRAANRRVERRASHVAPLQRNLPGLRSPTIKPPRIARPYVPPSHLSPYLGSPHPLHASPSSSCPSFFYLTPRYRLRQIGGLLLTCFSPASRLLLACIVRHGSSSRCVVSCR